MRKEKLAEARQFVEWALHDWLGASDKHERDQALRRLNYWATIADRICEAKYGAYKDEV